MRPRTSKGITAFILSIRVKKRFDKPSISHSRPALRRWLRLGGRSPRSGAPERLGGGSANWGRLPEVRQVTRGLAGDRRTGRLPEQTHPPTLPSKKAPHLRHLELTDMASKSAFRAVQREATDSRIDKAHGSGAWAGRREKAKEAKEAGAQQLTAAARRKGQEKPPWDGEKRKVH